MSMHRRIKLGVLILASSVLLACSGPGPRIDSRTGKPMLAGPWENRDLSLESFKVDFLGQYTVKHAFIKGINIFRCYPSSPPDNVQMVMERRSNGEDVPGIVASIGDGPPMVARKYAHFIGYPYYRSTPQPDGTVKKQVAGVEFNALCDAEFAGRNDINFGIRSTASESIQTKVQRVTDLINESYQGRPSNRAFLEAPRTETRWGNAWTWYRARIPTPVGDGVETWMTPIGDSGYYITVNFNFIEAARQQNTEDYQRARKLMDGILQSVVIQKQ
ncbi:DUF769 domain-containing protein [Xylella taiwanensis]|uniref:DUF769 domain-containing protein n=2 Tax=Xylella taiwanensis TaxID=1444770 RepID=A0ABS8U016_9GAMM|nr:DUF769 domain-containing protein [Xylella taiwanensis]AXI83698.1 hypothetical protein AB672_07020 [Xylella taiwanensis]MCD8456793.1 DUF769 domain-containing protein [Xylella taiwanensis]MCD8459203.1 DUF769 domain-containing protein [Xylella taiwanensis]MCD8461905.1 DUF769 domain-containing protein [Xylella taiwanensis]MCD8464291.1 DUF769 domain-containing protein [Xylella taiwanensis]